MHKAMLWVVPALLLPALHTTAQDKLKIRFGKVTPQDFTVSSPLADSNANAIVLADIGSSEFEGDNQGRFVLSYSRHRRVKILNKNGLDAATETLHLYGSGEDEEKVSALQGRTYNLENGNVVETRLEDKNVFRELVSKQRTNRKFTLPNVKEGSIIEYTYTIKSPYIFNLQPWVFQGEYPCLWSEYSVDIPEYFNYVFLSQGYQVFAVNTGEVHRTSFKIGFNGNSAERTETVPLDASVQYKHWVMKDVPALKEEPYTTTLANHIAKIEFQLAEIKYPQTPPKNVMGNWQTVSQQQMESEKFGVPINRQNGWLDAAMKEITQGSADKTASAQKIYNYVRDHFASQGGNSIFISEGNSLKDVFTKKSGTEAELNLLLIAMLRHEKITADPVLLSTRSNGVIHPTYPLMDRFNYVICRVLVDSTAYLLDASHPRLAFGRLPVACYNGTARVISSTPEAITIDPTMLQETSNTFVFIENEKNGPEGTVTTQLGENASLKMRNRMATEKPADYFREVAAGYTGEVKARNGVIDSLGLYDMPVGISYEIKLNLGNEDIIYFNPLLNESIKKNPFSSLKRLYPVEMPYAIDDTYILNMETPEGYKVDEMPKSARVKFNDNEGMFEYLVAVGKDGKIQLRCHLELQRTNFATEDYENLRNFFAYIVSKEGEQIVFKKIK